MEHKKYCFVPEKNKKISVFNAKNTSLGNYGNNNLTDFLNNVKSDISFNISLDSKDKAILFYIDGDNNVPGMLDYDYFHYKILNTLKILFSENEIIGFNLILNDESYFEFSIIYDTEGYPIKRKELERENDKKTLVAHTYRYNFYVKYKK